MLLRSSGCWPSRASEIIAKLPTFHALLLHNYSMKSCARGCNRACSPPAIQFILFREVCSQQRLGLGKHVWLQTTAHADDLFVIPKANITHASARSTSAQKSVGCSRHRHFFAVCSVMLTRASSFGVELQCQKKNTISNFITQQNCNARNCFAVCSCKSVVTTVAALKRSLTLALRANC